MEAFMKNLIQKANAANPALETDYVDPNDGLRHCGRCGTPKQTRLPPGLWAGQIVPCMCRCQIEAEKAEKERLQAQERQERVASLRRLGFPDAELARYTFSLDDGGNPTLSRAARRYVERFDLFLRDGQGLLLYGSPGTGKSFYAFCIANALIEQGVPCLVTGFSRIVNELQRRQERQTYIDNLSRFKLLVIDDFAAERDTEYMTEQVFSIVDARYRQRLPLIITTNLTGGEIKNASSVSKQRILSRLLEMCQPIEVTGEDRRRRFRAAENRRTRELLGL